MVQATVYIGTGEKEGFYTLRIARFNFPFCTDNYVKNLSTTWEKAEKAAKEYANKVGARYKGHRFELDEFRSLRAGDRWKMLLSFLPIPVENMKLPFGKYSGEKLGEVYKSNKKYLWWLVENITIRNDEIRLFAVVLASFLGDKEPPKSEHEKELEFYPTTTTPVPGTNDRVKFTGTMINAQLRSTPFGSKWKMLFHDDRGFKLWGSLPNTGAYIPPNGSRIEFVARVTVSDKDPAFGYYSRPTKVKVSPQPDDIINN